MAAEDAPLDAQAQLDAEPTETSPELIAQAPDELAQQLDSDVASPQQVAVLDTVNQRSTTTETGTSFVLPGSADEEESAQQPSHDLPLDPRIATTWLSEEVPEQHYEHDAQVQTPVVGEVRVILASGDVFEGRLVSVGEGRIWLASDLGRFALDSSAVDSVQRLVEASGGELGSMDDLLPGERVTVKLPGGSISGRIVATQGTRITLVTDSGARLTLDDPEIEIASRGSAIHLGGSTQDD